MKNTYVIKGKEVHMDINAGQVVTFDLEDLDLVKSYPNSWRRDKGKGAVHHKVMGKITTLSRLLLDNPKGKVVGCVDRNPLNLCKSNLVVSDNTGTILGSKTPTMKNNTYLEQGYGVIEILSRGSIHKSLVDTRDLGYLKELGITWCLASNGYVHGKVPGNTDKKVMLHRVLMKATNRSQIVDHINHDKLDNRRGNLRIVSHCENNLNKGVLCSHNTSGCTGVHWHSKREKWVANIEYQGKKKHLGYFQDKVEAIKARKQAEQSLGFL